MGNVVVFIRVILSIRGWVHVIPSPVNASKMRHNFRRMKMRFVLIFCLLLSAVTALEAQKPKNGTYTYTVAFAEWQGQSLGTTCTVIIDGNRIKVLSDGSGKLGGKKGVVLEEGLIMRHEKTGKWIIGHSAKDAKAKLIGGCTGGPSVIDFKNKKYRTC